MRGRLRAFLVLCSVGLVPLEGCKDTPKRELPASATTRPEGTPGTYHCEVDQSGNAETSYCVGPAPTCERVQSNNCALGTIVDTKKNTTVACGILFNRGKVCLPNR